MTQGFWNNPVPVITYPSATAALSEVETLKRGENESRLRLHVVEYSESFDQILMASSGITVELAIGYAAFTQLCQVLGLTPQRDFLRGLPANPVSAILNHYTLTLDPYEAKLVIHRRETTLLGGVAHYYEVKRLWPAKGDSHIPNERWYYNLMLLEQAGWEPLKVLISDDLFCAVLKCAENALNVKGQHFQRGILVTSSEVNTGHSYPIVINDRNQWMIVGDKLWTSTLDHDIAQLMIGSIGMWGPLVGYRGVEGEVTTTLAAMVEVSLAEASAAELLMRAGLSRKTSIQVVADIKREQGNVTMWKLSREIIDEEISNLHDDLATSLNHLVKFCTTVWP